MIWATPTDHEHPKFSVQNLVVTECDDGHDTHFLLSSELCKLVVIEPQILAVESGLRTTHNHRMFP
jgi:hypothetical protein